MDTSDVQAAKPDFKMPVSKTENWIVKLALRLSIFGLLAMLVGGILVYCDANDYDIMSIFSRHKHHRSSVGIDELMNVSAYLYLLYCIGCGILAFLLFRNAKQDRNAGLRDCGLFLLIAMAVLIVDNFLDYDYGFYSSVAYAVLLIIAGSRLGSSAKEYDNVSTLSGCIWFEVIMTIILVLYNFFVDYEYIGIGYLIITLLDAIAMLGIANSVTDLFTDEKSVSEYDAISNAES